MCKAITKHAEYKLLISYKLSYRYLVVIYNRYLGVEIMAFYISALNIFIAGGGDGRHVVEILGAAAQAKKVSVMVIEQNLMLYARQMLLISILLDDSTSMTPTEKSEIILEVLGNVKIRPSTAKYIRLRVSMLIDIVGNEASRDEDQPNGLR